MLKKLKKMFTPKIKSKVGRPKLAKKDLLKSVKIELVMAFVLCATLVLSGTSVLTGKSPLELLSFGAADKAKGSIVDGEISETYPVSCNGINYGKYRIRYYNKGTSGPINNLIVTANGERIYSVYYTTSPTWVKSPTFRYEIMINSKYNKNNYEEIQDTFFTINGCKIKLNYDKTKRAERAVVFLNIDNSKYSGKTSIKFGTYIFQNSTPPKTIELTRSFNVYIDNVAPVVSYVAVSPEVSEPYIRIWASENTHDTLNSRKDELTANVILYKYNSKTKLFEGTTKIKSIYSYEDNSYIGTHGYIDFKTAEGNKILKENQKYSIDITVVDKAKNKSKVYRYNFFVDEKGLVREYIPVTTTTTIATTTKTAIKTTSTEISEYAVSKNKTIGNVKVVIYANYKSPVAYGTMVRFPTIFTYTKLPSKGGDQYYKKFVQYYIDSNNRLTPLFTNLESYPCWKVDETAPSITPVMYIHQNKMYGRWLIYSDSSCKSMVGYMNTPLYEHTN